YEWQHNEYIPVVGYKYLFMTYIKNKFRKVWFNEIDNYFCNEELNNELSPIIKEYIKKDIYISIDKSILTVYSNKIAREEIIEIFEKIISIVNAYN
ncbi:MAG: hypothetical protein K2I49_01150, partial [Ureaplasma sp.]|nr:hypothetical protein [Ureaplasma sp.]